MPNISTVPPKVALEALKSIRSSLYHAKRITRAHADNAWAKKNREKAELFEKAYTDLIDASIDLYWKEIEIRKEIPLGQITAELRDISKDARKSMQDMKKLNKALKSAENIIKLVATLAKLLA